MRRLAGLGVLLAVTIAAAADGPSGPHRTPGAVEALRASLEVEKQMLAEDLADLRAAASRRTEAASSAASGLQALDELLRTEEAADAERLDAARAVLADVEATRSEALAEETALLDRVIERKRRIALLEVRMADLHSRTDEAAGPLSATWEVTLMPSGQRGTMVLAQYGALVSGTYTLVGGWSGSVQGTVVNRKVLLERIDAKVGRWGTLEGYLSADGKNIRGTWSRLELAGMDGAEGQWLASRAEEEAP